MTLLKSTRLRRAVLLTAFVALALALLVLCAGAETS
jgi:hypothetical protein